MSWWSTFGVNAPPAAAIARLIVISGPSGAGKGTLIANVIPSFDDVVHSVSATTRPPRAGEEDGKDYLFLSRSEFVRRVDEGQFLEWAEYGGNFYGTPVEAVERHLRAGRDVILEIELQGARQVRTRDPEAVMVFIEPPSIGHLESRLRNRGTEDEETIRVRLGHAQDELAHLNQDRDRERPEFDYVIFNDDVERASAQLRDVIEEIRKCDPRGDSGS